MVTRYVLTRDIDAVAPAHAQEFAEEGGLDTTTIIPPVFKVAGDHEGNLHTPLAVSPAVVAMSVGRAADNGYVKIVTDFDDSQIYLMSTADSLIYIQNDNGDTVMYTKFNGLTQLRPIVIQTAAPADADIDTGKAAIWFDATNGAAKLMVKAKQADGTVVTGSVSLA